MPHIFNRIPRDDVFLGLVIAEQVEGSSYPAAFHHELGTLLKERSQSLPPEEEALRGSVRDMLRNGSYRPTGRGKPASEYLLRVALEAEHAEVPADAFPRINALVDSCNYISLRYLLPISLWDLQQGEPEVFVFRLGREGESYVFNEAGQEVDLEDLIVGCRASDAQSDGEPIVNPIKDSMKTKTAATTTRVCGAIYAPSEAIETGRLESACTDFAALLAGCGTDVSARWTIVPPGESVEI